MSSNFKICLVLLLVCLPGRVTPAQEKNHTGNPSQPPVRKQSKASGERPDNHLVLTLLEQLRSEVNGIGDELLRIRLQAQIADAMWRLDETQARSTYTAALQAIESLATSPPDVRLSLWQETLAVISRRDHQWAVQLMEKLSAATSPEENDGLYISAALGLSDTAPEQALGIVEAGLKKNDSDLLRQTRQMLADQIKVRQPEKNSHAAASNDSLPDKQHLEIPPTGVAELTEEKFPFADQISSSGEAGYQSSSAEPAEIVRTVQLVMQLLNEGKLDQAIAATGQMRDARLRARFGGMVYLRAASEALDSEDYDTALHHAQQLSDPRQQALIFVHVSHQLQEKKETTRAIEVLRLAAQTVAGATNSSARAQGMLTVANAAANLDARTGFELMETAVAALNRADADKGKEDESDFEPREIEQGLTVLAKTNFDRAWLLARTIERPELSIIARLAVCTAGLPIR